MHLVDLEWKKQALEEPCDIGNVGTNLSLSFSIDSVERLFSALKM